MDACVVQKTPVPPTVIEVQSSDSDANSGSDPIGI